jgi:hypothetical protein
MGPARDNSQCDNPKHRRRPPNATITDFDHQLRIRLGPPLAEIIAGAGAASATGLTAFEPLGMSSMSPVFPSWSVVLGRMVAGPVSVSRSG